MKRSPVLKNTGQHIHTVPKTETNILGRTVKYDIGNIEPDYYFPNYGKNYKTYIGDKKVRLSTREEINLRLLKKFLVNEKIATRPLNVPLTTFLGTDEIIKKLLMIDVFKSNSRHACYTNIKNHTTRLRMKLNTSSNGNIMEPYGIQKNMINKVLNKFKTCKRDILVIPFSFYIYNPKQPLQAHMNMLVFNIVQKTLERFEPHGSKYGGSLKSDAKVDEFIVREFAKPLQLTYISPSELFCPRINKNKSIIKGKGYLGLQSIEGMVPKHLEVNLTNKLVEKGYCGIWSMFYAKLRVMFPSLDSQQVIETIFDVFSNNRNNSRSMKFRKLMRGQLRFIINQTNLMRKQYSLKYPRRPVLLTYQEATKYDQLRENGLRSRKFLDDPFKHRLNMIVKKNHNLFWKELDKYANRELERLIKQF
jgi:hypothetical protein